MSKVDINLRGVQVQGQRMWHGSVTSKDGAQLVEAVEGTVVGTFSALVERLGERALEYEDHIADLQDALEEAR